MGKRTKREIGIEDLLSKAEQKISKIVSAATWGKEEELKRDMKTPEDFENELREKMERSLIFVFDRSLISKYNKGNLINNGIELVINQEHLGEFKLSDNDISEIIENVLGIPDMLSEIIIELWDIKIWMGIRSMNNALLHEKEDKRTGLIRERLPLYRRALELYVVQKTSNNKAKFTESFDAALKELKEVNKEIYEYWGSEGSNKLHQTFKKWRLSKGINSDTKIKDVSFEVRLLKLSYIPDISIYNAMKVTDLLPR